MRSRDSAAEAGAGAPGHLGWRERHLSAKHEVPQAALKTSGVASTLLFCHVHDVMSQATDHSRGTKDEVPPLATEDPSMIRTESRRLRNARTLAVPRRSRPPFVPAGPPNEDPPHFIRLMDTVWAEEDELGE